MSELQPDSRLLPPIRATDKGVQIAKAMAASPLEGMIAYTNEGDGKGSASFTSAEGPVIVERDGNDYVLYPLDKDGKVVENIYDSAKPKLDSKG